MKKLFVYGGVFLLLIHHFFIWTLVFADDTILSMEIVEEAIQESNQTIESEESEEGILKEEFVIDNDLGDREDLVEETENTIVYITQEFSSEAISFPQVLITEVAFAGSQEWFELYNPHDINFVGTIDITGVRSSILTLQNITIPAKTAIVIARSQGLEIIVDTGVVYSIQTLSMPDTTPLYITLSISGEIVDIFSASISLMNQVNKSTNDRSSLQRTLDDISVVRLSPPSQNYNTIDPVKYKINPGIVYQSLSDTPPAACEKYGQIVQIREIFRGTQDHAPYIEIFTPQTFGQNITIGGSMLTEEFAVQIDQPAGHYHLISTVENSYTQQPFVSDNQKLSFSSGLGNIIIYGQSGQVLDKVDIILREDGYASYVDGIGCQRVADNIDNFSPGFAREYLSYFPVGAEKIITITQQIVIPSGGGSCTGDTQTGSIVATATGDFVMEFVSIDYDPPGSDTNRESIVVRSLVDYPLDLSVYALRLSTRNGLQYLRGVLEPEEEITLTGNFRFPNAGACVDLLYGDFIVDTYCYPVLGNGSGELENDYSDVSITIDSLVYDPPGDDTNNEEITFTVHTGIIDFAHGFYVLINGRKYNLTAFAGERFGTFTLKANYRMPNTQDACVSLLRGDFVFDTKCYTITKNTTTTNNPTSIHTDRFAYTIRIDHIDYDPEGSDTNNEKITLTMEQGSLVDLSQFHILINGTKKKLKDTLSPGQQRTLVGTYGFPNTKQTCVVLQYQDHVYDTYCYDPQEDKAKEQEASLRSGTITIDHIEYDPVGNDTNREEIHFSVVGPMIDFTQGRHLLINTSKKSLSTYGSIVSGYVVLTGTFSFPNTKDTCVSIRQYETMFDEYCYQIGKTPQKETIVYTGVGLTILAVLPNPIGADAGKEWVEVSLSSPSEVDLAQGFHLLVNGSKKKLTGSIIGSEPYRITGSFALPNAASCLSLLYMDTILDTFCYPQTKEGLIYTKNSQTLTALTDAELSLLKRITLTKFDKKVCLTLSEVTIKCRAVPAGKLAARQMEELKLSRNYITTLHDYLYNHRQIIYFNTDIIHYKTIFDQSKKDISNYQFTRPYGSEHIPISDIQTRFQLQYQQPLLQTVKSQIGSSLFGPKLAQNYQKAKERWYSQ